MRGVLVILFVVPSLALAIAPNPGSKTTWSNEEDFTLNPGSSGVTITPAPAHSLSRSTVKVELSGPSEQANAIPIPPSELILPYILRKIAEEKLAKELQRAENDSRSKADSFSNNFAEEPKTFMTPPPPPPSSQNLSSSEQNEPELTKTSEDSLSEEDGSDESTTVQSTAEESITNESMEEEPSDEENNGDKSSIVKESSDEEDKDAFPMKEYANKFQDYRPMMNIKNPSKNPNSELVDEQVLGEPSKDILQETSSIESSQEDQAEEENPSSSSFQPEIEDEITTEEPQQQPQSTSEEEKPGMDKVIFDKEEPTQDTQETYTKEQPKYYIFLKPKPSMITDDYSPVGTESVEPSSMTQMLPPKPYFARTNAWNMYPQQQPQPIYESTMEPIMAEHPSMTQGQNLPLMSMSGFNRDVDGYQFQPSIPMRNVIPMMAFQQPPQAYYGYQPSSQMMMSPQMYSGLGFQGDYLRNANWARPYPFYSNQYSRNYQSRYNYLPSAGYYNMGGQRYVF